ncbi:adenosylcobinamide amidohydrolase [Bacillus sp. A116_S68]|nr:adenosylcobinamide amidohydrolase [Bacillus sp. A116_S68]
MIELTKVSGGYDNEPIIKDVSLTIEKGEFFTLLGPNGSGKTTLFKLVTGTLPTKQGNICLKGQPLTSLSKLEKARHVAVLTQEAHISFDFTVEEIVSLGRYAFQQGLFKNLSKKDQAVIDDVMMLTDVARYRHKQFRTISGGEKQRVLLAKALAQQPDILLLDEPTNHLDVKHSFHMLNLLKQRQHTHGLTVFAILHDLNVAALYADRVGLLHEGRLRKVGSVDILKQEDELRAVYNVEVKAQAHPTLAKPQLLMTPASREEGHDVNPLETMMKVAKDDKAIHIQVEQPLRTISNGVVGEGIRWATDFCNFHVEKNYHCSTPADDVKRWMTERHISYENAVGMMTAVHLKDAVWINKVYEGIAIRVMVTAGVSNAVDIVSHERDDKISQIGTINTMVFLNRHFTDGALVNACLSATEAKTKALYDANVKDAYTGTLATGTSTDSLLIATTQRGEQKPYAGSGTPEGKAIGSVVYEATTKALAYYLDKGEHI